MNTLISIIVPIYNIVSRYPNALETCLNSIKDQTYKNLEIILVDDGSTDESGLICDRYSEIDHRFHTFHRNNQGIVKSREYGFMQSTGDFIFFSDADDMIHPQCIEIMHSIIVRHPDIKMVTASAYKTSSTTAETSTIRTVNYQVRSQSFYIYQRIFKGRFSVWNKLYHRSLFDDIHFNVTELEDFDFYLQAILKCNSIIEIDNETYYWIQRDLSVSHYNVPKRFLGILQTKIDAYSNYIKSDYTCYIGISLYNLYTGWIDIYNMTDDIQIKTELRDRIIEIKAKTWKDFWASNFSFIKKVLIWWFLQFPNHKLFFMKMKSLL